MCKDSNMHQNRRSKVQLNNDVVELLIGSQDISLIKTKVKDLKPNREDAERFSRLTDVHEWVVKQYNIVEQRLDNGEAEDRAALVEQSRNLRYLLYSIKSLLATLVMSWTG